MRHSTACTNGQRMLVAAGLVQIGILSALTGCSKPAGASTASDSSTLSIECNPSEVDIGDMQLRGYVERTVQILNVSQDSLLILDPQTDCGCAVARIVDNELAPGDTTTMTVRLGPFYAPQEITRTVLLKVKHGDKMQLTKLPISGRAVGSNWADPPYLNLQLSAEGAGIGKLKVSMEDDFQLEAADSGAGSVTLRRVVDAADIHFATYDVIVSSDTSGSTELIAISSDDPNVRLTIPLTWAARPACVLRPNALIVDCSDGVTTREVFLICDSSIQDRIDELKIVPHHKCIKLIKKRVVREGVIAISIQVDPQLALEGFEGEVIAVELPKTVDKIQALSLKIIE